MTAPVNNPSNEFLNAQVFIPGSNESVSPKKKRVIDEDALITQLRNKERKGYELLYDAYGATLLGVITRIIEDTESAEDLLSETFVKIVSSFEQYDSSRGRLFTWMINITRNLCFDKLRSKEFRNQTKNLKIDDATELLTNHTTSFDPSYAELRSLTAKLDPKEKLLIDLAYFKGYTQTEIAEELNMPLGTVKLDCGRL